jgi:hypothetical protein
MVGMPFKEGDGCGDVTAIARNLPLWTKGDTAAAVPKIMSTWPPIKSVIAGSRASIRHVRHLNAGEVSQHFAGQVSRSPIAL